VLERSVRIFGAFRHSADLDVARAEGNLGAALTHAGRPLEARPHLWKSYRDLQKLVEDPHPSLTTARVLLIQCASASGDEAEIQSILESITSKEAAADLLNTIGPPIGIIIDPDQVDENTDRPDKS
jgi:hypothetical protein